MFISNTIIKNETLIDRVENDTDCLYIYRDGDNSLINEMIINEMILRFKN